MFFKVESLRSKVVCRFSFVLCPLPFALCPLPFVVCRLSLVFSRLSIVHQRFMFFCAIFVQNYFLLSPLPFLHSDCCIVTVIVTGCF